MSGDWSLISFENEDVFHQLFDEADCIDAIRSGALLPATDVEIVIGAKKFVIPAASSQILAPLFKQDPPTFLIADEALGTIPLQDVSAPATIEHAEVSQLATGDVPDRLPVSPVDPQGQNFESDPLSGVFDRLRRQRWMVAGLIAAAMLGWFLLLGKDAPMDMWALRNSPVHATADDKRPTGAFILRGEAIKVRNLSTGWMKIASGRFKGQFLRARDLGEASPPSLDGTSAGARKARHETPVFAAPNITASVLQTVNRPDVVVVSGAVLPDRKWLEVEVSQDRIGYVNASAFGDNLASVEGPASVSSPRQLPVVIERKVRPPEPLAPPPRSPTCGMTSGWAACMAQTVPTIALLDGQLLNSWQSASQRLGAAPSGLSPANWRFGQDSCSRRQSCLAAAYRNRIAELNAMRAAPPPVSTYTPTAPAWRNRSGLIGADDYPESAMRKSQQGVVGVAIQVGTDGRPKGCSVRSSSGHAALDETTCRLIMRRAQFTPAKDGYGRVVEGSMNTSIKWRLSAE